MLDEKLEELQNFTTRYLKTIAIDIVVVLVALAYIFYQMVKLEPTNVNPFVLVAQSLMGILCGIAIKTALGENGFSRGYNSKFWLDEEDKYNQACNMANPYMERVDNYYQYEEIIKKRNYRRATLQGAKLKYDMWFDNDGYYIGTKENYDKLDRKQKRILNKCVRVKIYLPNLFSQYNISVDQDTKKEITDKSQRTKNLARNSLSAVIIAIIGVYFIPVITSWSWGSFIGSTLQVVMWILFGIFQLVNNYNFVVQDKVALLRKKKEDIKKFFSNCEKGMYIYGPYDEHQNLVDNKLECDRM